MSRTLAVSTLVALAALCGACGGGNDESGPIVIGTSLPLTGQDSQTGEIVKRGYQAWEKSVNARGGMLGRKVELKILDDVSNQNTVLSDYNALISRHEVDFVIGTFSTRLTLPALSVAERHRMLYLDPAGAAPEVFKRGSKLYFYTEPAPPSDWGVPFAKYVAGLPAGRRPRSVAFVITQDPFTSSTVGGMRNTLAEAGIRTVVDADYPLGTQNFDPIASRVKQSGAELVVNAGGFAEEVGFARALIKAGARPRFVYQTVSPGLFDDYPKALGAPNTEGVFWSARYTPDLGSYGNRELVRAFKSLYRTEPSGGAAFAFATGQVLEAAVKAVGEKGVEDQEALAEWLHVNAVKTVIGRLKWDAAGLPHGDFATGQWQGGAPEIVLPDDLASTDRILPCWRAC